MVKAGNRAIASFQEREKWLAELEEEKVELTCRLRTVSDVVSDKEKKYKNLLTMWKEGMNKIVKEAAGWKMKREMKK